VEKLQLEKLCNLIVYYISLQFHSSKLRHSNKKTSQINVKFLAKLGHGDQQRRLEFGGDTGRGHRLHCGRHEERWFTNLRFFNEFIKI
jgi:hypothetical protein